MNLLAAAALAAIGLVALAVGRSALFPPVIFCTVWSGAMVLLELSGSTFYPISDQARFVFVTGALAFLTGAALSEWVFAHSPPTGTERYRLPDGVAARIVDLTIVVMIAAFPFYWAEVQAAVRATAVENALLAARMRGLGRAAGLTPELPFLLRNLVQLSIVIALFSFNEAKPVRGWRIRSGVIFALALAYQLLTGGRVGALTLVVGTVAVLWIRSGHFRLRPLLPAAALFAFSFSIIAIQLEKGTARRGMSLVENIPSVVEGLQAYSLGGVVAFDRIAETPNVLPSTGGIWRTAQQMANRLGADYEIPALHAPYTSVGDFIDTNVYTMYFSYLPDFGLLGTAFLVAVIGAVTSAVFRLALRGNPAARVFYGLFFVGVCQSVFNEPFYTNVNLLSKALVILGLVYGITALRQQSLDRGPEAA